MLDIQTCTQCKEDKPTIRKKKRFVCQDCHAQIGVAWNKLIQINNGNIREGGDIC
jgi:hypothetical protein